MADDKKKIGSESVVFHKDHHKEVLFKVLPALLLLGALAQQLFVWWDNLKFSTGQSIWEKFLAYLHSWGPAFRFFSLVITVGAVALWLYSYLRLKQIEHEEEKVFGHEDLDVLITAANKSEDTRWEKILSHAHSENPAEWRVAIMDADTMLDDAIRSKGFHGEGLGEILRSMEPGDLVNLEAAKQAHWVRNRIAHDGQSFELTERETKRVISLYEATLRELGAI
jgi:hypothetical protein